MLASLRVRGFDSCYSKWFSGGLRTGAHRIIVALLETSRSLKNVQISWSEVEVGVFQMGDEAARSFAANLERVCSDVEEQCRDAAASQYCSIAVLQYCSAVYASLQTCLHWWCFKFWPSLDKAKSLVSQTSRHVARLAPGLRWALKRARLFKTRSLGITGSKSDPN